MDDVPLFAVQRECWEYPCSQSNPFSIFVSGMGGHLHVPGRTIFLERRHFLIKGVPSVRTFAITKKTACFNLVVAAKYRHRLLFMYDQKYVY
jgi:hypothetical protein